MILQKGIPAPDFELNATPDQKLKLTDFRGKRVILAFPNGNQLDSYDESYESLAAAVQSLE